jgi:hypothetical protein
LWLAIVLFASCGEESRFEIGAEDNIPPAAPVFVDYKPLYGGARLYFHPSPDEDVLSINAEYTGVNGKNHWFSVSYFSDSLDVWGFSNTDEQTVRLYALDRSGNRSEAVIVPVVPLEPAINRVAQSLKVVSAFDAFFIEWENELTKDVNVYVDYSFDRDGKQYDITKIYTSRLIAEKQFINNLKLANQPVRVKVRVEDYYGNMTEALDFGTIYPLYEEKLPKDRWSLPVATGELMGGVPMAFLNGYEGRSYMVIDDEINAEFKPNLGNAGGRGRTGKLINGNVPWNVMIDLGDYYELSRVITWQYTWGFTSENNDFYRSENIGIYNMYFWDEEAEAWELIRQHKIPVPEAGWDMVAQGSKGDEALMYPDDPQYTKPTRWFRYEALKGFNNNYTNTTNANWLSEITLYGKKAN